MRKKTTPVVYSNYDNHYPQTWLGRWHTEEQDHREDVEGISLFYPFQRMSVGNADMLLINPNNAEHGCS